MSKSTLFSLFVIAIAIIIVMDVKVNDYDTDGEANVLAEQPAPEEMVDPGLIESENGDIGESEIVEEQVEARVTFNLVNQGGFTNVTLQMVPFNGILMEKVDMRDFLSVSVVKQNLLEDNRDVIAEFNEFHAESSILANEIYLLIREKAQGEIDTGINENNDFGEKSFYINYGDEKSTAFLVVKISESVYALRYEKALHGNVKTLLQLLI